MKKFVIVLMAIMMVAGIALAEKTKEIYPTNVTYVADGGTRQGGEDIATAEPILALPFTEVGTTVGYADDYQWTTDTAADVVYSYTPDVDMTVDVELCGSLYDTRLGIVDVDLNVLGYNDDSCGLQSALYGIDLLAGVTYYVIVDGYASNEGEYTIFMDGLPTVPPGPGESCETAVELIDDDLVNSCPGAEFWYMFTAPFDGYIMLDTCIEGQTVDTYIRVYDACEGNVLAFNDDAECEFYSFASYLEVPVVEGQVLYILFDDNYSTAPFDFNLFVSDGVVATDAATFGSVKSMYR